VSVDVVVAVDMWAWNLLGECVEAPAAKTADKLVVAGLEKPLGW
jgi:capsular polysaccharide biosynthesis protein